MKTNWDFPSCQRKRKSLTTPLLSFLCPLATQALLCCPATWHRLCLVWQWCCVLPAGWGVVSSLFTPSWSRSSDSASAQRSPKPPLEGVSDGARVLSCRAVSGLLCARAAVLGGVSGADPCLGSWKWVQSSLTSVTTRQHWDVCARRCLCVGFESHGQPRSFPSSLLHVIS